MCELGAWEWWRINGKFTEQPVDGFFEVEFCVLKNNLKPGKRTLDPISSVMSDTQRTAECFSFVNLCVMSFWDHWTDLLFYMKFLLREPLEEAEMLPKGCDGLPNHLQSSLPHRSSCEWWLLTAYNWISPQALPQLKGAFCSKVTPHPKMGCIGWPRCLCLGQFWWAVPSSPWVWLRPPLQMIHNPSAPLPRPASLMGVDMLLHPFQSLLGKPYLRPRFYSELVVEKKVGHSFQAQALLVTQGGGEIGSQGCSLVSSCPTQSQWLRCLGSSVKTEGCRRWWGLASLLTSPPVPLSMSTFCAWLWLPPGPGTGCLPQAVPTKALWVWTWRASTCTQAGLCCCLARIFGSPLHDAVWALGFTAALPAPRMFPNQVAFYQCLDRQMEDRSS